MPRSILIVDDDARVRASLSDALAAQAEKVIAVESAEHALSVIADVRPDVVLSDVRMQGMDGLQLLRLLRERMPGLDVVLMTAYDDLATVAAAMRAGAADFLVKPLDLHQLRSVLDKVFADRDARARRPSKAEDNTGGTTQYELVGRDPRMIDIFKIVGQVAASRTTVMIRGESGTGKELIARAIHSTSPYASEPFVAVNCTALPSTLLESELFGHMRGSFTGATADRRGRFAQAGRGTIFLDEIGDTTPEFQSKLLRVLQEHEFHPVGADQPQRAEARVIAATHRNLERLVQGGEFREDLYYRLRVVEIAIPPLRERMSDVPLLAKALVRRASEAAGRETPVLSREALDTMMAHTWPGNVRELENSVTRAVVLATGGVIRPEQLAIGAPPEGVGAAPSLTTLEAREAEHVTRVLETVQWHKARAAKILGVSRPRLDRLLKKYSIAMPDRRPS